MQCSHCNHQVENADAHFCSHCGNRFQRDGCCAACNAPLHPSANFCDRCGYPVASESDSLVGPHQIKAVIQEEVKRLVAEAQADRVIQREKSRQSKLLRYGMKESDWVRVAGGKFIMGSPPEEHQRFDNERQHKVEVEPFEILKTPVTFEMFDIFCSEVKHPRAKDEGWGREKRPVINVTYWSAIEYCTWLSKSTGKHVRLPTEAEWEFACRAGSATPFWTGGSISTEQANFDGGFTYGGSEKGAARGMTTPVDMFAPNPWGLRDMHGNVWEWCSSRYDEEYSGDETEDAGYFRDDLSERVVRGGSWYNVPGGLRSASRNKLGPNLHYLRVGFRIARDVG